jgi:hypothetical protein
VRIPVIFAHEALYLSGCVYCTGNYRGYSLQYNTLSPRLRAFLCQIAQLRLN